MKMHAILLGVVAGLSFTLPSSPSLGATATEGPEARGTFVAEMREELYAGKFDELERIGLEVNEKGSRFDDGAWKLHYFFDGVSTPKQSTDVEKDWKELFALLEQWNQKSNSSIARNALGAAQLRYAWRNRSIKTADKLTDQQVAIFFEWLKKSRQTLESALSLQPKCVDIYRNLLEVGLGLGWTKEEMLKTLHEVTAIAPTYYGAHSIVGVYFLKKWYGQEGDWQRFLNSLPAMAPGDAGLELYTRVAMNIYSQHKKNFFGPDKETNVNWATMKSGFEVIRKAWPDSDQELNLYGFFAYTAKDRDTAKALLTEINKRNALRLSIWGNAAQFDTASRWILQD